MLVCKLCSPLRRGDLFFYESRAEESVRVFIPLCVEEKEKRLETMDFRLDIDFLREESVRLIESTGLGHGLAVSLQSIVSLGVILLLAWYTGRLARWIMKEVAPHIADKTKTIWDDKLVDNRFFTKLSYYLLGAVFFFLDDLIASEGIRKFSETLTGTFFTIVTILVISSFLDTIYQVYKERNPKEKGNLKIYIQLIKVVVYSFGAIVIISFFANKNFIDILKGLGAMATILLIVYKDTILGFVAGISLSANKMLEVGDWIVVPNCNADGTVLEIGLNTVKVQNWDMTITTVPPYKLISESFINWRGMEQSGGRRIKRSISIDIDSIHFLSVEEVERFEKFKLLKEYIQEKKKYLQENNPNEDILCNQRHLTNVGTFKAYIENYLKASEKVHPKMTFLVRQLQSTATGLPIEIYFFSKEQAWGEYEQIQADIFDHIFAVTKEFGLRIFQNVSASSLATIAEHIDPAGRK